MEKDFTFYITFLDNGEFHSSIKSYILYKIIKVLHNNDIKEQYGAKPLCSIRAALEFINEIIARAISNNIDFTIYKLQHYIPYIVV